MAGAGLAIVAAVLLAGCADGQVQRGDEGSQAGYIVGDGSVTLIPPDEREPAPDFAAPYLSEDGEFTLSSALGEVVVLNVWGSWCPPCRKEAPDLQAVHEQVQDDGVRLIGVNTRDTEVNALAFEEEFGLTYESLVDPNGTELLAFRGTLPPTTFPTTLVIDREGQMAARVLGPISEASLLDLLDDVDGAS